MSSLTSRLRKGALLASGTALVVIGLAACSGSGVSIGSGDKGDDGNGGSGIITGTSDHFNKTTDLGDEISKGILPADIPYKATDISYETQNDKTFASWKGQAAKIESCEASTTTTVPKFPSTVAKKGKATNVLDCGKVHQATVGDYTYYWGAITK